MIILQPTYAVARLSLFRSFGRLRDGCGSRYARSLHFACIVSMYRCVDITVNKNSELFLTGSAHYYLSTQVDQ